MTPYRSSACRIGTHHACPHREPAPAAPAAAPGAPDLPGVPVVYEACACPCHPPAAPRPRPEAAP
ncbi:hypothetical protein ACWD4X_30370 [Streptomyces termitum]